MTLANKKFLLSQDLAEQRQTQFFFEGVRITQENGTNPRIRRLSNRESNEFITISESLPEYSVRVINYSGTPTFTTTAIYWILFGSQKIPYKCLDIKKSSEEGLYTTLYLFRDIGREIQTV